MAQKADTAQLIDLLARNEEAVSRLYEVYTEKFPAQSRLWEGLAAEEKTHADWIRSLASGSAKIPVVINEGHFHAGAIRTSIDYVQAQALAAAAPDMSLLNSLSVAFDLEQSMIEKNFFMVFEGDDAAVQRVLNNLREATVAHREKLHKALARHGGSA